MPEKSEHLKYEGKHSLSFMRFWDRLVIGLFRGTFRRYFCVVTAEAAALGHIPSSAIPNMVAVESHLNRGEKRNPGALLRNFLTLPLWCVVLVFSPKNDDPFAKDSRESFTNKVTPEALFLGFLIWLSILLVLGSVILHKTLPAS